MSSSGLATEQVTDTTPLKVHRRVRWGECDPAGVVYTVNFCEYVASAFELFMAELRTFDLIIEGRSKNGRNIFRAKLTPIAVDPQQFRFPES
jgi:hypothetical protein